MKTKMQVAVILPLVPAGAHMFVFDGKRIFPSMSVSGQITALARCFTFYQKSGEIPQTIATGGELPLGNVPETYPDGSIIVGCEVFPGDTEMKLAIRFKGQMDLLSAMIGTVAA